MNRQELQVLKRWALECETRMKQVQQDAQEMLQEYARWYSAFLREKGELEDEEQEARRFKSS